jgi:hypothetical protein
LFTIVWVQYKFIVQIPAGINGELFNSLLEMANCVDQYSCTGTGGRGNVWVTVVCELLVDVVDRCLTFTGDTGIGETVRSIGSGSYGGVVFGGNVNKSIGDAVVSL